MAVLKKEELLAKVKSIVADKTDDETLAFIEDVTDTINDMTKEEKEDWKTKYEENDKKWREKYKARFFGENEEQDEEDEEENAADYSAKNYSFDKLFSEGDK